MNLEAVQGGQAAVVLQAEGKAELRASPVPHLGFKEVLEGVQVTEGPDPSSLCCPGSHLEWLGNLGEADKSQSSQGSDRALSNQRELSLPMAGVGSGWDFPFQPKPWVGSFDEVLP